MAKQKDVITAITNARITELNIEAAVAYNNAAIKYHGEFARLNVINTKK